jgi:hypothetical protein
VHRPSARGFRFRDLGVSRRLPAAGVSDARRSFPPCSAILAATSATSLSAQVLERTIPLTDNDPSSADHPFGITLDPSGTSAYVPLCGLPAFSNFAASNNDNVVKIDLWTGAQIAVGQTELFPETPAW